MDIKANQFAQNEVETFLVKTPNFVCNIDSDSDSDSDSDNNQGIEEILDFLFNLARKV